MSNPSRTQDEQKRMLARANDMRKAGYSRDLIEKRIGVTYRTLQKIASQLNTKLTP